MGLSDWVSPSNKLQRSSGGKSRTTEHIVLSRDGDDQAVVDSLLEDLPWPSDYRHEKAWRKAVMEHYSGCLRSFVATQRRTQVLLQDRVYQLQEQIQTERIDQSRRYQGMESEHREEVRRCQAAYQTQVDQVTQELRNLESEHREDIRRRQAAYQTREDQVTQELRKLEIVLAQKHQDHRRAEAEHAQERNSHQDEMARVRSDHDDAIRSLEETQNTVVRGLEQQHADDLGRRVREHDQHTRHFRKQIEEINAALMEQDEDVYTGKLFSTSGLPQMTDKKIKESFARVAMAVEDIGRVDWRPDRRVWMEDDLDGVSGEIQAKKVKKAVVHDTIWCLLFQFVFASPFRMLGDLAQDLEDQWVEQSGQAISESNDEYVWPPTSAKTERWRYMTLANCREALKTNPISEFDPRAQVRKGFLKSQNELTKSMKAALEPVILLDANTSTRIEHLGKTAQILWLDYQLHRCRIVVALPGSSSNNLSQRMDGLLNSGAKLTVLPELRRWGTIEGTALDVSSTIADYVGKTLDLP